MNREEFEQAYADKYTGGDLTPVRDNRDGEGYTDHHIDLSWKVQQIKDEDMEDEQSVMLAYLEW